MKMRTSYRLIRNLISIVFVLIGIIRSLCVSAVDIDMIIIIIIIVVIAVFIVTCEMPARKRHLC